jgi:prepilin-type N-terminal cleavage/methylation domain-containing protein
MIKKLKKGFTLVELVVVIAVVTILSAVAIVSYISITNKARESVDHSMIDQINTSVSTSSVLQRKGTLHEVLEDLKEDAGFGIEKLKAEVKDAEFVYSYSMNKFAYWKDNKVVYPEDVAKNPAASGVDLWFFKDLTSSSLTEGHSYYIKSSTVETVTSDGGIDVGSQSIPTINYVHDEDPGQNVVIRSNGGQLNVTAPHDTVDWYGCSKVNINSIDSASFHAHGRPIGEVKIGSGHYVVESSYETNFLVQGNDVSISTKTNDEIVVLKDSGVSSYTVNGVVYNNSSVVSGETSTATIDESKSVLNANTKVSYETLNEAISAASYGAKLVLLKDINVVDNSPTPTGNNNNFAIKVVDKAFSLNGNGKTITSDGKHSGAYTSHDLFNLEQGSAYTHDISMEIYNANIVATHYQDVFLLNSDVDYEFKLTVSDSTITCDGETVYSNGPKAVAVLNDCKLVHEGQYAPGKDDRYYSALIVGYGGIVNAYNCKIESFGNGVTTFPSGGIVNLFNTDVSIEPVQDSSNSGYALRSTMEPNNYEGIYVIRGAEINVHGGNVVGAFSLKDTSTAYDAKISIFEGKFTHNPSDYVVEGKTCTQSGSFWIVK